MLFKELTLKGFDGSGNTDYLIVWIALEPEFLPKLEALAASNEASIDDLGYLFVEYGDYIDPAIDLVIIRESDIGMIKWETGNK